MASDPSQFGPPPEWHTTQEEKAKQEAEAAPSPEEATQSPEGEDSETAKPEDQAEAAPEAVSEPEQQPEESLEDRLKKRQPFGQPEPEQPSPERTPDDQPEQSSKPRKPGRKTDPPKRKAAAPRSAAPKDRFISGKDPATGRRRVARKSQWDAGDASRKASEDAAMDERNQAANQGKGYDQLRQEFLQRQPAADLQRAVAAKVEPPSPAPTAATESQGQPAGEAGKSPGDTTGGQPAVGSETVSKAPAASPAPALTPNEALDKSLGAAQSATGPSAPTPQTGSEPTPGPTGKPVEPPKPQPVDQNKGAPPTGGKQPGGTEAGGIALATAIGQLVAIAREIVTKLDKIVEDTKTMNTTLTAIKDKPTGFN